MVTGEVIVGAHVFRDVFASIGDIVGGRRSQSGPKQAAIPPNPGRAVLNRNGGYRLD